MINGNHLTRRVDRHFKKKKDEESNIGDLWDNIKQANLHIIGIPEREEREQDWNCIWRNYGWKLSKPKEWIRYSGTRKMEDLKQGESKQTHIKTF